MKAMKRVLLTRSRWQRRISIAFGLYSAVLSLAFVAFLLVNRSTILQGGYDFVDTLLTAPTLSFIAALLSYRRSENAISWLLVVVALLRQTAYVHLPVSLALAENIEPTLGLLLIGNVWIWIAGLTYTILAFVFVLFPTGRLPSRRWRPAAWLLGLQALLVAGLCLFLALDLWLAFTQAAVYRLDLTLTPLVDRGPLGPAMHVRPVPELERLGKAMVVVALAMVLLGLWAQVSRYRRGDSLQRQQIKWVILALIVWIIGLIQVALPLGLSPQMIFPLISLLIPISIAVAILRYRLYDIDIIINRALVYSLLTGTLALVYFSSVVFMQQILQPLTGQQSSFAVVVSTLLMAALFSPLRRRIQRFIDRRFYRRRYNAQKTLSRFAAVARDEIDLDDLTADLLHRVQDTVQPEHLSLWLRKR